MSDRPDDWMPLHIGAYLADTMHLTTAEHGAYLLLICAYWRDGEPLADDDVKLSRIVRATPKEWAKLRPTLAEFFTVADGGWRHKRIDQELVKAAEIMAAKKARTEAATRARAAQRNGQRDVERDDQRNVDVTFTPLPSPSPLPSPKEEDNSDRTSLVEPVRRAEARPKRGTRWESDAKVPSEWIAEGHERRAAHGLPAVDLDLEAEQFANHWRGKAGSSGVKADWRATWRNWALRAKGNGNGRQQESALDRDLRALARVAQGGGGPARPDATTPPDGDHDQRRGAAAALGGLPARSSGLVARDDRRGV